MNNVRERINKMDGNDTEKLMLQVVDKEIKALCSLMFC